jgi:hypothetical protein
MPPSRLGRAGAAAWAGVVPLLLPPVSADGETYLFTKDAASAMGVAQCTISQWRRRGLLEPVDGCPPRKPLYRLTDLRKAEQAARENAIRTSGSDLRVRRLRGIDL